MGEIDVAHIKKAVEVLEEAISHFRKRIEQRDIDGIIVNYCYDVKLLKDNDYLIKIYRTGMVVDNFYLRVKKNNKIICDLDIDVFDKDIVKEIEREIKNIYDKVKELLNNQIKKEGGDNMDKEIITNEIMVHIYKIGGVKKVRVVFCKDCYELEDVKNILSKLDGINGDVLVLEGRAPIWLYCSIVAYLKNMFKRIMIYDPKIGGYVVVYSLEKINLGKIEKEEE